MSALLDTKSLMSSVSFIGYNTLFFSMLIDSDSSNSFIDTTFINKNSLYSYFVSLLQLCLFDGTTNSTITEAINLSICLSISDITLMTFYVTLLGGSYSLVLEHNWLILHNPLIDWVLSSISFHALEQTMPETPSSPLQPPDLSPPANTIQSDIHCFSDHKLNHIMIISAPAFALACHLEGPIQFSLQVQPKKTTLYFTFTTFKPANLARVPSEYHDFTDVFSKSKASQLALHCEYDL